MSASGEQVKALVRSHASGNDETFYSVVLQIAAQAARRGHHRLAAELQTTVDSAQKKKRKSFPSREKQDDLSDLLISSRPSISLRDLVLSEELSGQIYRVLSEQRQRKRLLDHGFEPIHKLLLEGPPGTGKTMTAAVIAHELSLPLFTIRLDSLISKFMGETAGKLRAIFDRIEEQRGIYLFDEFDALGGDRSSNDVGEARRILNSFLVFLESSSTESIVIAATNHRAILDGALFRRFDMVLKYSLPDSAEAVAVMRHRLGSLSYGVNWKVLSAEMMDLSHADLVRAAESAAKSAILSGKEKVSTTDLVISLRARQVGSRG